MDEVNLSGHEDEFVEAAVFEVDFSKPAQGVDMEKPRFFADFADGGLFGGFAGLNVALGDGPAVFAVLNQQDFDVFFVFGQAKNDAAGGRFADDFLDDRLFAKDGFLEFVDGRGTVLFRKSFRNFEVTSLPFDRLTLGLCRPLRGRLWVFLAFHDGLLRSRRQIGLTV